MANTIRIKRRAEGGAAGAPASLENAELAFNEQDNTLYYGKGTGGAGGSATVIIPIGGSGAFTAIAHVGSGGTAHADVVAAGASGFMTGADKTKLDAITGTNTGDETTATIKTKLGITTLSGSNTGDQTNITGNAGTATALQTARTINGVSFNGTANITINAVDSTARIASTEKGVANGVATLDASGLVPASQLPSFVDDVMEYANLAGFPITGEVGKIYVALDTNKTYRWSGSVYVYITSGAVDSVGGYTGVVTALQVSAATTAGYGYTPYSSLNPAGYTTNLGTITSVGATAPVASTGGTTPVISMAESSGTVSGYLSAANFAIFNAKLDANSTIDGGVY